MECSSTDGNSDESQLSCYGRILESDWIDVGLIKEWIENCATLHGDSCSNPTGLSQVSPDWLIDTSKSCIVPGRGIVEYVALSYRWGTSKGFRMGTEGYNIEVVRQPRALAEAHIASILPASIADAIQLVRSIGERYLWVDAMCVDQSDKAHLGRQIEMMGAIYASAKLTIVATDGDATSGINGLKGISSSRGLEQVILPLFEHFKVIRTLTCGFRNISHFRNLYSCFNMEGDSEYFQRGWTHQEFNLSKRRLIFYKRRVFWQCTCADWYEDLIPERMETPRQKYYARSSFQSSLLLKGVPVLDRLSSVLMDYNSREHSYAEDALPGITGLLSILSRSFEAGFLCGLPEACFDAALMWHTDVDPSQTRRRVDSGKGYSALPSPLPSWSSVGWQTPALWIAEGETLFVTQYDRLCKTTPITQWFTHESPRSAKKRAILPTWFRFRQSLETSSSSLPPGWAKREPKNDYCRRFSPQWLPFPINTAYEDRVPSSPPQTPFISCKTKRGWFTAGRIDSIDSRLRHLEGMRMILSSDKFNICGTIEPHASIDTLLGATTDGLLTIELTAICAQIQRNRYTHGNDELHEVYGVLWIEWVDGVAYRQGSGAVYKEAWEAHDLEDVDLILG
ncbi:heterokaryon incompatibility protein-domain-containing protein [Xylaria sp. FL1777]|nr:heterokaryon incompatibility protein-domain-containing protein [Xylaria sp. FL1777]